MGKPTSILGYCLGLNTRDHPSELSADEGVYLSKAVNVDITDKGGVCRRDGFSVISDGYTNAHSLFGYLDRFAIFADDTSLLRYDSTDDSVVDITTELTTDLPVSYALIGDMLVYTNGIDRGVITSSGSTAYDTAFPFDGDDYRELISFPMVDEMHFFNGAMYGGVKGENFLYCSEPYKLNCYDQLKGYILLESPLRWVKSVGSGVLVGTDNGVVAFAGSGVANFQEKIISLSPSITCSEYLTLDMSSGDEQVTSVNGVLALDDKGIFFISDQFEKLNMTAKLNLNWEGISGGSFGLSNNSYIFSGVTV